MKRKLLIDGKRPTLRSLELFLEGLEHSVVTIMISCARVAQRAEDLSLRVEALEKKQRARRKR